MTFNIKKYFIQYTLVYFSVASIFFIGCASMYVAFSLLHSPAHSAETEDKNPEYVVVIESDRETSRASNPHNLADYTRHLSKGSMTITLKKASDVEDLDEIPGFNLGRSQPPMIGDNEMDKLVIRDVGDRFHYTQLPPMARKTLSEGDSEVIQFPDFHCGGGSSFTFCQHYSFPAIEIPYNNFVTMCPKHDPLSGDYKFGLCRVNGGSQLPIAPIRHYSGIDKHPIES